MKKENLIIIIITILILITIIIVFLKDSPTTSENELNKTQIINLILSNATINPGPRPESIMECSQETKKYYLMTPECCDSYNQVYNEKGEYICAPSGGFSGRGDGSCPNSLNLTNCVNVWKN